MTAGIRGRKPRRLNSHINVVPYIDVMLVLLVIFMVTAPLMAPAVVDLPKVAAATASPAANTLALEVVVQKDGALKLSDRDPTRAVQLSVTVKDLVSQVKSRMNPGEERPVVIAADKGVIYDRVLEVMDALKTGGIARVGLSVVPKT